MIEINIEEKIKEVKKEYERYNQAMVEADKKIREMEAERRKIKARQNMLLKLLGKLKAEEEYNRK